MCVLAVLLPETITALCLPDSLTRRHCQVYFPGRVLGRLLSVVAAARLLVAVAPVSLVLGEPPLGAPFLGMYLFLGCGVFCLAAARLLSLWLLFLLGVPSLGAPFLRMYLFLGCGVFPL